jgi:hypothetical protein
MLGLEGFFDTTVHEEAQAPPEWTILGLFRSFPTDPFRAGLWSAANLLNHSMIGCLLSAVIGMAAIDSNAVAVTHCAVRAFQGRRTLPVRIKVPLVPLHASFLSMES